MLVDAQADEHGQAEAGAGPADLGPVPGDDPVGLQGLDPAQAGRRGQAHRVGQVDVGRPPVPLELGTMARSTLSGTCCGMILSL